MFATYLAITLITAASNAFSAVLDFVRYEKVIVAMAKARVSTSWLTSLGLLEAAGAVGLLVGIAVPVLGIAAAAGLTLFFVAAIVVHLRVRDYALGLRAFFLSLAVGSLIFRLIA